MSLMLIIWEKQNQTVASIFRRLVAKHPNKTAFLMDDKKLTFQEVKLQHFCFFSFFLIKYFLQIEDLSNKVGNYFRSKGYKKGDSVSLLMETRPDYSSMWLGLSKIGCITALINTNLRKETLIHSIRAASSKAIIVSAELTDAIAELLSDEEIKKLSIFVYDTENEKAKTLGTSSVDLVKELEGASKAYIDTSENRPKDKLFYIYTSGTTGMPKVRIRKMI